jgi:hypothetical protein
MRHSLRGWLVIAAIVVGIGGGVGGGSPGSFTVGVAQAKSKGATKAAADSGPAKAVNACGCYKDTAGACFCGKKGKCACPGDCEPKGCEEKRNKEIQKEVAAETKKAAEADKKQRQSSHDKSMQPTKKSTKKSTKKKSDNSGP